MSQPKCPDSIPMSQPKCPDSIPMSLPKCPDSIPVLVATFFFAEEALRNISLKLVELSEPKFYMQFGKLCGPRKGCPGLPQTVPGCVVLGRDVQGCHRLSLVVWSSEGMSRVATDCPWIS